MKTTIKILVIVLVLAGFGFGIYAIVQSQEKKKLLEEIKSRINALENRDKEFLTPYIDKFSNLSLKELKLVRKYIEFSKNEGNFSNDEKKEVLTLIQKGFLPQGT